LKVYSRAQYLTAQVAKMRPVDYDATLLVHAVKGKQISGKQYTTVKIGNSYVAIRDGNKDRAIEWFAEWAAPIVRAQSSAMKVLIPIPNRSAFLKSGTTPRTALIANAIRKAVGTNDAVVADILRWTKELPKSTNGESRRPDVLVQHLALVGPVPWGTPIFVDDVFTTGGHAVASAWKLREAGRTVSCLVCCGRTCHDQLDNPFQVAPEDLSLPPFSSH
jgi:hypothetical protein